MAFPAGSWAVAVKVYGRFVYREPGGRVVTGGRRERGRPPGFRYGPKRPKGARNQPPSDIGVEARVCEIGLEARAVSAPAAAPRPTAAAVVRGASPSVGDAFGTQVDRNNTKNTYHTIFLDLLQR